MDIVQEADGFYVVDPSGKRLNDTPFKTRAEAQEFMQFASQGAELGKGGLPAPPLPVGPGGPAGPGGLPIPAQVPPPGPPVGLPPGGPPVGRPSALPQRRPGLLPR